MSVGGIKYMPSAYGGQKVLKVLSYELSVMIGQSHSMGLQSWTWVPLQEPQVFLATETPP